MRRFRCWKTAWLILISLAFFQSANAQTTYYVDASATLGGNSGASWGDAYLDLQSALAVVVSGDEIQVATGTYYPTSGSDRTISFTLTAGVNLRGGYPAGGGTRDWEANVTILSGDIGTLGVDTDNSQHVLVGADNMTLDGFTITKGYWDSNVAGPREGAGLYIAGAKYPHILNCRFVDNHSWYRGAGIYFGYTANSTVGPLVSNCYFSLNTTTYASAEGSAIHAYHRVPITIVGTIFEDNTSTRSGAAIYSTYNDLIISNCVFRRNTSQTTGGAIWHQRNDLTSLTPSMVVDCDFYENTSIAGYGGAMYWSRAYNTTDQFRNNRFFANEALQGGAIRFYTCGGTIEACIFSGNRSVNNTGGAIHAEYSAFTFRNVVLVGNNSGHRGGGIYYVNSNGSSGGPKSFENVLLAGNKCVYDGGGICIYGGGGTAYEFEVKNCTIVNNKTTQTSATYGGGGLFFRAGAFAVTNTLLYANDATSGSGEQIYLSLSSSPTAL
ncbi:MAG: hypothetical protein O3A51_05305, partial [Verrucomicrobia bacterium]|nr:hypothetical protein [Verrucomicrobiota bacterium]